MAGRRRYRRRRASGRVSKRIKRYVKSEISRNIETKEFHSYTNKTATTTWQVACLNNIVEGDQPDQVIGATLEPKRLTGNICVRRGDGTNKVRIIIFQWFEEATLSETFESNWPTIEQILPQVSDDLGNDQNMVATPNYQGRHLFKMLKDYKIELSSAYKDAVNIRVRIPARKLRKMQWVDDQPPSNGHALGAIFMYYWSDSTASSHPTIYWDMRFRYKDA